MDDTSCTRQSLIHVYDQNIMTDLGFSEPSELKSAVEEWAVAVPELQDKASRLESIEVRVSFENDLQVISRHYSKH